MALGGGTFLSHNKSIPGSYINFVSQAKASTTLSDRGIVAIAMPLDWGDEIIEIDATDFIKESLKYVGYPHVHEKNLWIRELFLGAKKAIIYRINHNGQKAFLEAEGLIIKAKYGGTRGNNLSISIEEGLDKDSFEVFTWFDSTMVHRQTAKNLKELKDNAFVTFHFNEDAPLWEMSHMFLSGGENGVLSANTYQEFLDKMEAYTFHALAYAGVDEGTKSLFAAYTKNMREEYGIKFQTVLFNFLANYEGVISVDNKVKERENAAELVFWVAGQVAGLPINRSLINKKYDGSLEIDVAYKQSELIKGLKEGRFLFHQVGNDIRVLDDINTFVSFSDEKSEDFKDNQVLRILDQIGNDIALIFKERYMGKVQNDDSGRLAFWNDLMNYFTTLRQIRAINDFEGTDIVVEIGEDKKSVLVTTMIEPISVMAKLYMTVIVR